MKRCLASVNCPQRIYYTTISLQAGELTSPALNFRRPASHPRDSSPHSGRVRLKTASQSSERQLHDFLDILTGIICRHISVDIREPHILENLGDIPELVLNRRSGPARNRTSHQRTDKVGLDERPLRAIVHPHPYVGIHKGSSFISSPISSSFAHAARIPGALENVQEDFIKNIKPISFLQ